MTERFIGLMSGTSLDGADGVLAQFEQGQLQVLQFASAPFSAALRAVLLALNSTGDNELHRAALAANALARCYADVVHALLQGGSGRFAAFVYGLLPNAAAELTSYTVYRWECAIRASVVMGFVGAGGLGQQIDLSLRMFAGGEVASMLLTFLLLVLLADALSRVLRGRLA